MTRFKGSRATYTITRHLIMAQALHPVAIVVYKYENRLAGFAALEPIAAPPIASQTLEGGSRS